jgi:energy-coupling factor transporter transmembrane protein EcfT
VRLRDSAALLGGFFLRTAHRAERVELAMALRGYRPENAGRRGRFVAVDALAIGASLLASIGVHVAGRGLA